MTRHGARILFGLGLVSALAIFAAAGAAALTPKPGARIEPQDVGIVSFARLRDGVPERVTMHDDVGLDTKARDLRGRGPYHPMSGRPHQEELPVWVIKDGSSVRAFIAIDPRNSCDLEVRAQLLHDVCHGSIYNFDACTSAVHRRGRSTSSSSASVATSCTPIVTRCSPASSSCDRRPRTVAAAR
jgi:hypothetical protein